MRTLDIRALLVLGVIACLGPSNLSYAQSSAVPRSNMVELRAFGGVFLPDTDLALRNSPVEAGIPIAPIFGGGIGYYPLSYLGVEGEFAAATPNLTRSDDPANVRVGYAYVLNPRGQLVLGIPWRVSPFVLGGGGVQIVNFESTLAENSQTRGTLHWGAGLKAFITRNFLIRAEGRHNLVYLTNFFEGTPLSQWEVLGSLSLTFGGAPAGDKDRDGVFMPRDKCPATKGILRDGCPDSDGDGLSDQEDVCPKLPGRTEDGCPDRDNDNIVDNRDACPDTPGQLTNGCPDPDSDGDTINDDVDRCPKSPGVAPSGCPNRDGDALVDIDDQCPDAPEIINGFQDDDGCPDELPREIKRFNGTIRGIRFGSGRARIQRSSFTILNEAVFVLKQYPDLKLHIEGHTDSAGGRLSNQALSRKRANAVKAYFIENGIDPTRITTAGMGEDRPVASNRTRSGRRQNRRIEFKLIYPTAPPPNTQTPPLSR